VAISPDDEWAISGDETGVVSLWEVSTGHQTATWRFDQKIGSLTWCPKKDISFFLVGL
jgi:ribosome biogenesis protein ERB1